MRDGGLYNISYKVREGGRVAGKVSVLGGQMMKEEVF